MEPNALLQYGALGVFVAALLVAVKILWNRSVSEREACTKELAVVNAKLLELAQTQAEEYRTLIEKIGSVLESLTRKIEGRGGRRGG